VVRRGGDESRGPARQSHRHDQERRTAAARASRFGSWVLRAPRRSASLSGSSQRESRARLGTRRAAPRHRRDGPGKTQRPRARDPPRRLPRSLRRSERPRGPRTAQACHGGGKSVARVHPDRARDGGDENTARHLCARARRLRSTGRRGKTACPRRDRSLAGGRAREPARFGAMARLAASSPHRPRRGEPALGTLLRRGARAHAGGLRTAGRGPDASRTARLSRAALSRERLGREGTAQRDRDVAHLPTGFGFHDDGSGSARSREPAPRARSLGTAHRRNVARPVARRGGFVSADDRRSERQALPASRTVGGGLLQRRRQLHGRYR